MSDIEVGRAHTGCTQSTTPVSRWRDQSTLKCWKSAWVKQCAVVGAGDSSTRRASCHTAGLVHHAGVSPGSRRRVGSYTGNAKVSCWISVSVRPSERSRLQGPSGTGRRYPDRLIRTAAVPSVTDPSLAAKRRGAGIRVPSKRPRTRASRASVSAWSAAVKSVQRRRTTVVRAPQDDSTDSAWTVDVMPPRNRRTRRIRPPARPH